MLPALFNTFYALPIFAVIYGFLVLASFPLLAAFGILALARPSPEKFAFVRALTVSGGSFAFAAVILLAFPFFAP